MDLMVESLALFQPILCVVFCLDMPLLLITLSLFLI